MSRVRHLRVVATNRSPQRRRYPKRMPLKFTTNRKVITLLKGLLGTGLYGRTIGEVAERCLTAELRRILNGGGV